MANRKLTDTATVSWDEATAAQVKGNVVDDSVTNAKLANMAQATIKGRQAAAGTGDPGDLAAAEAKTILGIPTTTVDNTVPRFDGTAGNSQTSGVIIDDSNNMLFPNAAWIQGRNAANSANLNMFRVNTQNFTEFSNPLYFDSTGNFSERNAAFTIERNIATPVVVQASLYSLVQGKGDNTTQLGVSAGYFQARDRTDVTGANKGVLYAGQFDVFPIVDRNNFPFDDVVGVIVSNIGNARGTEAIFIGHNVTGGGRDWQIGVSVEAHTLEAAFQASGTHAYGLDFARSATTFSASAIRIPNNTLISARNVAGSADMELLKLDASNVLQIGGGVTSIASSKAGSWSALQTFTTSGSFGQPATFVSTNADAIAGPVIFLDRSSASPAASDFIGLLAFSGRNASAAFTQYAALASSISDTTAGSEDGLLNVQTVVAGTLANRVIVGQGLQIGTPAAGDLGSGTLNAAGAIQGSSSIKSISATAGIGYATGAGGAVTQATSKSTGVTLNAVCGAITMNAANLAAVTNVSFTWTNSALAVGDIIAWSHESGGTLGAYNIEAISSSGQAVVTVRNLTAGTLGEALVLGFVVIKGVRA